MPIKLEPPLEKEFILKKSDKEMKNKGEPTTITIRQAREGQNVTRNQLFERIVRKEDYDGTIAIQQDISPAVVRRKEIYLTLIACNLLGLDGEPLFTFPMDEKKFNDAYSLLPPIIVEEIHEKVLEVNITWAIEGESG